MSLNKESFRVWVWFKGDSKPHLDTDWSNDMNVIKGAIARLTLGPSRFINETIKIVDEMDYTVFKWKDGKVIFPKQEEEKC